MMIIYLASAMAFSSRLASKSGTCHRHHIIHTHVYPAQKYIYIYIYIERERERESSRKAAGYTINKREGASAY